MKQLILRRKNKSQSDIILSIFFIIIVLIIIFIFSRYHEIMLTSNYHMNREKINSNMIYSLRNELVSCYGYPLRIKENVSCQNLRYVNYRIETIENGICRNEVVLTQGMETINSNVLFIPVYQNNTYNTCIGKLIAYFDQNDY